MSIKSQKVLVYSVVGAFIMATIGLALTGEPGGAIWGALGGILIGASLARGIIQLDGFILLASTAIGGVAGAVLGRVPQFAFQGVFIGLLLGFAIVFIRHLVRL